ncbi:MAG: restriction endonuclease subunit S [Polyangiaceae bacterium]
MSFPRYPEYKDSGVEWLGEVPAHWEPFPLKRDLAFLTSGSRGWAENYADEGELFIRIANLTRNGIDLDLHQTQRVSVPEGAEGSRTRVQAGDVLFSITADLGSVAVVPDHLGVAYVSQHVALARLRQSRTVPRWVAYVALSSIGQRWFEAQSYGGTKIQLSLDDVRGLPIPVPPQNEQTAIVGFLDRETAKIDALVAEQQRLIDLLKEKRQAVISHAVTKGLNSDAPMKPSGVEWLGEVPAHWATTSLRALFRQQKRQEQTGKAVLSVYREYGVILKDSRDDNINKTPEDTSSYQLVNPGDLVVNKMKAWQGSLGLSSLEGITSPDYAVFVPRHRESPAFLHLLLRSQPMVSVYRSISNGIRPDQWRLEPDVFLGLPIFLPPEQEQRALVSHLGDISSRCDALTSEAQQAVDLLLERRTALISAAVTGQIDVRGAVARSAA